MSLNQDTFSIYFKGFFQSPATENYTFKIRTNGRVKLIFQDQLIIEASDVPSEPLNLQAGVFYQIKLYFAYSSHDFYE